MTNRRHTSALRPLLLGACALAALAPAMARAQDEVLDQAEAKGSAENATASGTGSETASDSGTDQARIIVTGSRLARSTFDTPSPVTLIGADDLQRRGITNVAEAITELPSFRDSTSPQTQGFGSFNVGARISNLRGLGVTRNLILVDGRRFAPTTREGSVDLNFIPSILISRTEIVTGGASAAYGSDAITGVVNVILDDKYEGFKSEIDMGIADAGDGRRFHVAAAFGTRIGDKGHFVIAGNIRTRRASAIASRATGARRARWSPIRAMRPRMQVAPLSATACPICCATTPMPGLISTMRASSMRAGPRRV